jgi:hypothetical protein
MRTILSLCLVIMFSLNTAYAASVGVCDALEHAPNHAAHLGHHNHEHSDDPIHDDTQASGDEAGKLTAVNGHHHDHVHSSFSVILPCIIGMMPLIEPDSLVVIPTRNFVSAPQTSIEYPPKATLA